MNAMPGSAASSDYGNELDYTDAALDAELDALEQAARGGAVERSAGAAHVEVALEGRGEAERFRQRRGWGGLSVSDLSGPSWCEFQHSYRLATKPYLPPLERPATITTAAGTTIAVDSRRTVRREKVLDRGKEVHAQIEREVMGELQEVKVEVTGKEEWWALRVLNTCVCLDALIETGRVRELPVVGWVGDFLVFGVCDEVERRDLVPPEPRPSASPPVRPAPPATPSRASARKKGKKREASPETPRRQGAEQRLLEHFFSPVPSPKHALNGRSKDGVTEALQVDLTTEDGFVEEAAGTPRWTFILSDTKTRFNASIPSHAESRPARLQLMLYHRLLTSLISSPSSPSAFSWPRLYTHLALSPTATLSSAFLASLAPILSGSPSLLATLSRATTLEQFVATLQQYGALLSSAGGSAWLSDELEISYRLREPARGRWKSRRPIPAEKRARDAGAAEDMQDAGGSEGAEKRRRAEREADEEEDLRRALEISLREVSAEEAAPPVAAGAAVGAPVSAGVDEFDIVDTQLEDSQLPFLANPSLPIPVDVPPTADPPSSSLAASAEAFALPFNSQSSANGSSEAPAAVVRSSRYNLRRRPLPQPATSASAVDSAATPDPAVALPTASATEPPRAASPASTASTAFDPDADPSHIGTESFANDAVELDAWLENVVAYWRGEREPIGVALSEVNRCSRGSFITGN
ncbi:hypothetical protein Rhopal_006960-T1 [Rhodotorula paludigena]|uniref:Proteophosphoglycan ppg4 n=1 Tax=Rhodotorula paludigena TaxID=86838 RepID=A0AAV5GMT8_9BASI|nr:hypothetical protein Rhopal_006960-T1 [Rhodotorula paludigena]